MRIGILWHGELFKWAYSLLPLEKSFEFTGGNTGNLAYVQGILNLFYGNISFHKWGANVKNIRDSVDVLIFPCANQLGKHVDIDLSNWLYDIGLPVIALGLGAQSSIESEIPELTSNTLRWLQALVELSPAKGKPNLILRGDYTRKVIDHYGFGASAIVGGCPSQFINLKGVSDNLHLKANGDLSRLAINSSHFSWDWAKRIDSECIAWKMNYGGEYITQSPDISVFASYGEFNSELTKLEHLIMYKQFLDLDLDLDDHQFLCWCNHNTRTFFNIDSWIEAIKKYDFSVGTRIHGSIIGSLAGLPSLLITHDTRTKELAESIGVPNLSFDDSRIRKNVVENSIAILKDYDFSLIDKKRELNHKIFSEVFESIGITIKKLEFYNGN
jgi:hypothetical protein